MDPVQWSETTWMFIWLGFFVFVVLLGILKAYADYYDDH